MAQPCTTSDATGCKCEDNSQTNCDLLPDITISGWALANYLGGPTEYSQSGNGVNNGRLRLSGSTPNIGHGPFTVGSVQMWTCGNDTFTSLPANCPNGGTPKQLIRQKIYHKSGNSMSYWTRWAGSMTYHPGHGHMHVDDWAIFTLRVEDQNEPDPRKWPIVGDGAKVGFCLMDYGTCSFYNGHCRDSLNNILLNGDFQNWGLGGGQYNCSPIEQGISVGHTDIYDENLDGMWINIPPGTCNGDYYIVIEVDPHNYFLESNETNNWTAMPITLTQQLPPGQGIAIIDPQGPTHVCHNDTVWLKANAGTDYVWSTGDTTQMIAATSSGSYTVTVTSSCGTATSDPMVVQFEGQQNAPTAIDDEVCEGNSATVHALGTGNFAWYDAPVGGNFLGNGTSYYTPTLFSTTTYYVETTQNLPAQNYKVGPVDNTFGSGNFLNTSSPYLLFDAYQAFLLKSVWVNANGAGNRLIELRDHNGIILHSSNVYIPAGGSRVYLNFQVPVGTNFQLGVGNNPNLYRNDGGVAYPYAQSGVLSIKNSSIGPSYYFFFYDWEIGMPGMNCSSPRVPATVTVNALPQPTFSGLNANYFENDPSTLLSAMPAGGFFSGPGISGNIFDPALAGPGGPYTITYSYTDPNGCSASTTQTVTVQPFVSVDDQKPAAFVRVFPNPGNGKFRIRTQNMPSPRIHLRLLTLQGAILRQESRELVMDRSESDLDLTGLSAGIYLLELRSGDQRWVERIVLQPE